MTGEHGELAANLIKSLKHKRLQFCEMSYFSKHAKKSSLSGEEEALMRSFRR